MFQPQNIIVIVIVWDACREEFCLTERNGIQITPNLRRFADDSIVFTKAFAAAPWTPPSHASLFTGLYPSKHKYVNDGNSLKGQHIADLLSQNGFDTNCIASGKFRPSTPLCGAFDTVLESPRVFERPRTFKQLKKYHIPLSLEFITFIPKYLLGIENGEYIKTKLLEKMINTGENKPSFSFIRYMSPHSPYTPVRKCRRQFRHKNRNNIDNSKIDELCRRGGFKYMTQEISPTNQEWEAVQDRYAAEISYADSLFGQIISYLKKNGVYDDSFIIVTSDHGEHFGEHNRAYHQFSLYDELLHIPLVMEIAKNRIRGEDVSELISPVDVYPTILQLCEIDVPQSDGQSLLPPHQVNRSSIVAEYGKPDGPIKALQSNTDKNLTPA